MTLSPHLPQPIPLRTLDSPHPIPLRTLDLQQLGPRRTLAQTIQEVGKSNRKQTLDFQRPRPPTPNTARLGRALGPLPRPLPGPTPLGGRNLQGRPPAEEPEGDSVSRAPSRRPAHRPPPRSPAPPPYHKPPLF